MKRVSLNSIHSLSLFLSFCFAKRLSPSRACSTHFRSLPLSRVHTIHIYTHIHRNKQTHAHSLSFPQKITTSQVELSLFLDAQTWAEIAHPRCPIAKESESAILGCPGTRGEVVRLPGRLRSAPLFSSPLGESRLGPLGRKGLTIPELDFNTLYFMSSFFFFLYIFSYRICRYTFLANPKKLIPK